MSHVNSESKLVPFLAKEFIIVMHACFILFIQKFGPTNVNLFRVLLLCYFYWLIFSLHIVIFFNEKPFGVGLSFKNFIQRYVLNLVFPLKCYIAIMHMNIFFFIFQTYMSSHGSFHQSSCALTQQNGVVVPNNRHLREIIHALFIHHQPFLDLGGGEFLWN